MNIFKSIYDRDIIELNKKRKLFEKLILSNLFFGIFVYLFTLYIYITTMLIGLTVIGIGLYVVCIILAIDESNYLFVIDTVIKQKLEVDKKND